MEEAQTNLVVDLVANFHYFMHDPTDKDITQAKGFLRKLWELVTNQGTSISLTREYIDRCVQGGFAVHYPADRPVLMNVFVKQAPSIEWAEQAYHFSIENTESERFRMMSSEKPFIYGDGLVLFVTNFMLGWNLDRFLLESAREENATPYIEPIADQCLDDLVHWQTDSPDYMMTSRPAPEAIADDLKQKILLGAHHARQFGTVDITDPELELLETALGIFDRLQLNEATIVPVADYCPKNLGIRKDIVRPTIEEILEVITSRSKPDTAKIRKSLYHWDPAAKWGHFLEDFCAFFQSYELWLNEKQGSKGESPLDKRYKDYLERRYDEDKSFKELVDAEGFSRWNWKDKLADHFRRDSYLMLFYRTLRKADLSLTKYAWRNENVSRGRINGEYDLTRTLLPKQISFYVGSAAEAMRNYLRSFSSQDISDLSLVSDGKQRQQLVRHFQNEFGCQSQNMDVSYASFLFHYANNLLRGLKIDYTALTDVKDPSTFETLNR